MVWLMAHLKGSIYFENCQLNNHPYLITSASTAQPITNAADVLTALTHRDTLTFGSEINFKPEQFEAPVAASSQIFCYRNEFS